MKEVSFLEKLAETLLEGGFVRAMKPKLQPVQIAKALTREMEQGQVVGAEGPLVPNGYLVYLHPDDLDGFAGFRTSLERELASYLRGYAARHGLRMLAPPTVKLLAADMPVVRSKVTVKAAIVDPTPEVSPSGEELGRRLEGTVVMPALPSASEPDEARPQPMPDTPLVEQPSAYLLDDRDQRFMLKAGGTSIGRAVNNDIVLEVAGVSRHHARILWEPEQYLLLDLGSTNGSFVSGERVTRHPLSSGDRLSFGGAEFTFHLVDPEE